MMNFSEFQEGVRLTDEKKNITVSMLGLVGEIGSIQSVYKKLLLQKRSKNPTSFHTELSEEIGDTLWYLGSIANIAGLSLDKIALSNLLKAAALFSPGEIKYRDRDLPTDEQLPRKLKVLFKEREVGRSVQVKMFINGVIVGDALTDNAHDEDGYRYHDAFHLAYAAILGWSPVTRAVLKRKRKSVPKTDEVEDGARAQIVEEAISIFIFNHARRNQFYEDPSSIGFGLLKTILSMASNLEVSDCTAKQWGAAIEKGYEMFRLLCANHGGSLSLDLDNAIISYSPELE